MSLESVTRQAKADPEDLLAKTRLETTRKRLGLCANHGLKAGKRGTCRTCRAEAKVKREREKLVKEMVIELYDERQSRDSHPEGSFDNGGRWYPTDREDHFGDIVHKVRSPSRSYPYSYMLRARTKKHCRVLILGALEGHDVPDDVAMIVKKHTP